MQRALTLKHRPGRVFRDFLIHSAHLIGTFVRKNTVMCIAAVLAAISAIIIPPDAMYAGYFDFKTLSCSNLKGIALSSIASI